MGKKQTIKSKLKDGSIKERSYERNEEIRFPCSKLMKEQLYNIADHLGIDRPAFFKMESRKIISSYPEKMLQPIAKF